MKYLTKEWYELCQRTNLYFDMRVNEYAKVYDEALFLRLYKRREREFVKTQREVYDVDPRFMMEHDGEIFIPVDKFITGEALSEEDKIVYHMSAEEKEHIRKLIEVYDARPPFDEDKCKEKFAALQKIRQKEAADKLPPTLISRIADMSVFALGYCTKEIFHGLKVISKKNTVEMNRVLNEYRRAQQRENIPSNILEIFNFHDCQVTDFLVVGNNIVMKFDTSGGFSDYNKIVFVSSEIIKQDGQIINGIWLYEELYRVDNDYEIHMLITGDKLSELTIRCSDIIAG